ncbi:hypothetical protein OHD54_12760, partial [Enterococcus hirae]|nr:hypothetical protein [Enterococcus hirae]MCV3132484.1 hypothetical protein [Enterococcus hirae]
NTTSSCSNGWLCRTISSFNAATNRGLNEHSNGLLRKDGLPKEMDFNQVNQGFISSVASKRNHIPRKSLNYQTPLEVFLSYVNGKFCLA